MPLYLVQASYTSQALAAMVKDPEDRSQAIRPMVEGAGGRLRDVFFCQRDYDIIVLGQIAHHIGQEFRGRARPGARRPLARAGGRGAGSRRPTG